MSAAYPLMRGCAPILVALVGGLLLGEHLPLWAWAGIGLICTGIAGTLTSYGVVLWAMTQAPVAMISALRETSILFGVVISALVLRERVTRRRWMAAGLIVVGAAVLRAV